ncbi:hypothetical protein E9228_002979 [Curtobacterium flaccumfaciens]|uniref:WYL domain-containing protein n=1 Tax=Curtobacterium salicis TaxID=1779862 RepID=A0ABX0TCY4_9MICO|nr:hypothetical protein [Curtobacterium sp. WW7]NII42321.1 hypothetical protein [Curtobacterium sp. WW7]
MPDSPVLPTLDLQHTWRGALCRVRVFRDRVTAETSYERETLLPVPMEAVSGWRIEECDFDAVCVEFVTMTEIWRVLLSPADESLADMALRSALGAPMPAAS